jgi:synaptic vesicle membrane protein VAT-1
VVNKAADSRWASDARFTSGFDVVLDPNGQSTLRTSYEQLRPTGRLVIYGFQSMLPRGRGRPNFWRLLFTYLRTPRFDPLRMTDQNRSVMAFNLSYLFDHLERLEEAMSELLEWAQEGNVRPLPVELHSFDDVAKAHQRLQSGTTTGRLVLTTAPLQPTERPLLTTARD